MHSHLRQEIRTVSNNNCESSSGVEHHLAKVGVAGSNPVFRSNTKRFQGSSGGIGRHAGLKIQWTVRSVWVQVPSRVPSLYKISCKGFFVQEQYLDFFKEYIVNKIMSFVIEVCCFACDIKNSCSRVKKKKHPLKAA